MVLPHWLGDLVGRICGLLVMRSVVYGICLGRDRLRRGRLPAWGSSHGWTFEPGPSQAFPKVLGKASGAGDWTMSTVVDGRRVTACRFAGHFAVAVELSAAYPKVAVRLRKGGRHPRWYPNSAMYGGPFAKPRGRRAHRIFEGRYTVVAPADGGFFVLANSRLVALYRRGPVPPWVVSGHELLAVFPRGWGNPGRVPRLTCTALTLAAAIDRDGAPRSHDGRTAVDGARAGQPG